ncbi:hypothetical protein ABZ746_37135 [Streptomyces sp. NPDC020096]
MSLSALRPSGGGFGGRARRLWRGCGPRLSGVVWVGARQGRTVYGAALTTLIVVCGWLAYQGHEVSSYVTAHHLQGCTIVYQPWRCEGTSAAVLALDDAHGSAVESTGLVLMALPPALGLFCGAPLLAKELESGTYQLAWSQSISRTRWLAGRLGVPLAVTLAGATILAVVSTWWVNTVLGRFPAYIQWYTWMSRSTSGPAVVGFCLLGVALGAAIGLLVRRTVTSIAVTAVVMTGLRVLIERLRLAFVRPETITTPVHLVAVGPGSPTGLSALFAPALPPDATLVGNGFLTSDGLRIPQPTDMNSTSGSAQLSCPSNEPLCLAHQHEVVRAYADIHSAAANWPMMVTETAMCLVLTVLLTAFCFAWIRRVP